MERFTAVILGGSGSVGIHIVRALQQEAGCEKVVLVSRRPLPEISAANSKVEVRIAEPLETMNESHVNGARVAFCTLGHGSARRADKDDLMRVDAELPGQFARVCKEGGVKYFSLMTSVGADETARYSWFTGTAAGGGWYMHVKGTAERLAREAGFAWLDIVRPGGLIGSPWTPTWLGWIPNSLMPARYSSASVEAIGQAMVRRAVRAMRTNSNGVEIIEGGVPIITSAMD